MKLILKLGFILFFFISCNKTELQKEFSCKNESFDGEAENVFDVKNTFSVQLPKHWKTNLFYDEMQSSIYAADTIKQLTETVLIDITHIQSSYKFDAIFKNKLAHNDSIQELSNKNQKEFQFKNKKAFYSISNGQKSNFSYQILNIFVIKNETNSFHFKTEIYGDTDINQRFCKALNTYNSISFHEP